MYAVIAHSGTQHRISEGDEIVLDQINAEAGSSIDIEEVLLIGGDKVKAGNPPSRAPRSPSRSSATSSATSAAHSHRPTRRSRVRKGQRPSYTRVKVTKIKA